MGVRKVTKRIQAPIVWIPNELRRSGRLPAATRRELLRRLSINLAVLEGRVAHGLGRSMPSMSSQAEVQDYIRDLCYWMTPQIHFEPIKKDDANLSVQVPPRTPKHVINSMLEISKSLLPTVQFTDESHDFIIGLGMHFGELIRRACVDALWQIEHDETHSFSYFSVGRSGRRMAPYSYQNFMRAAFKALGFREGTLTDTVLTLWTAQVGDCFPPRELT